MKENSHVEKVYLNGKNIVVAENLGDIIGTQNQEWME